MSWGWGSRRGRVLSRVGLGVLGWFITPDLVDEAVGEGLAWEMRLRSLPSRLGVYFVLALCLFSAKGYGPVLGELTGGLEDALAAAGWREPATTALTQARRRVGEMPLMSLFWRLCPGPAQGRAAWSHAGDLLLVAWDGTRVAVPATAENIAVFGRERRVRAGGDGRHYPQIRLVSLIACGTRALLGAAMGPLTGKGSGEQALAGQLLGRLGPGMLLLADRLFYSWALWHAAAGTGAELLWRVRADLRLSPCQVLPDRSWLARVADPAGVRRRTVRNGKRRRRGSPLPPDTAPVPSMTVRVIEFFIAVTDDQGRTRTEPYRLITTLTDWRRHPAQTLAAAYAQRWAIETGYREFKTCLRGPGRILRSRTPDLARQELWAYLCIYQAIRMIICRAAAGAGLDPDQISFTRALDIARTAMPAARTSMNQALARAEDTLTSASHLVPERHGRVWQRALAQPGSAFPARKTSTHPISHKASYTIRITPPGATRTPARTSPSQHQPPANHPSQPP